MSEFTLVRHSAYADAADPAFEDAVEARELSGTEVYSVKAAGGVLFDTREAAQLAEAAANYPDGSKAAGPHASGYFSNLRIGSAEIYVPRSR